MSDNLFNSFQPVSKEAFKTQIVKDLKGKNYKDTLLWLAENQTIEPFYHQEDLDLLMKKYKEATFFSTSETQGRFWKVIENIKVDDAVQANKEAVNALMNGAEAIQFDLQDHPITPTNYDVLIKNIQLNIADVSFINYSLIDVDLLSPMLHIAQDTITQNLLYQNESSLADINKWKQILKNPTAFNLCVDTATYQNAGASIVTQLAYGLAITNEYLQSCLDTELKSITGIKIKMAVGGNFFFEVAKLRVVRKIFQVLLKQYELENLPLYLETSSTCNNKSRLDENNNMLRNTNECMVAAIGGSDAIYIHAHDFLTHPSENGKRWSRNISHILRNESYFDKVNDPTKGSYYVETITDMLGEASWNLFKEIEQDGGFLQAVAQGKVEKLMEANASELQSAFEKKSIVLVGVNKYQNELEVLDPKTNTTTNSYSCLAPLRLAEPFEIKNKIKAVLFDMDGVLLDSEPFYRKMNIDWLKSKNHHLEESEYVQFVGMDASKMWLILKEKFQLKESVAELVAQEKESKYKILKENSLVPIKGIVSLIGLLKTNGYLLAVASSSQKINVKTALEKLKLAHFFDVIVSGEDIENGKPAPDIFLLAAKQLGVKSNECIIIEDAANGIKAANAAGMLSFGFQNPNSGNQDLAGATYIIHDITDIKLELFDVR